MKQKKCRSVSMYLGIISIITGLICNKFVIEALFSSDKSISTISVNAGIVVLQLVLIGGGILYLMQQRQLLSLVGIGIVVLFALQFWIRVSLSIPHQENRIFQSLPAPVSFFQAPWMYHDQVTQYEAQFTPLKKKLDSERVVGYVTSPHLPREQAEFHQGLTSYALVPVNVEWFHVRELTIGNFPDFEEFPQLAIPEGFTVLEDFGHGILMLKRIAE